MNDSFVSLVKNLFWHLRHNVFIYMFWDAPQYKSYELNNQWGRVKYMAQGIFLFGGIFFANALSSESLPPPQYKDLVPTTGLLSKVILKDARGRNVSLIEVVDVKGEVWIFPKGYKHLNISPTGLDILRKKYVDKEILIMWHENKKIIFGSKIDVWEIKSCS